MNNREEKIMVMLAMLAQQSGEEVSRERLKFTYERTENIPLDVLLGGLNTLLERAKKFPTVVEIRESCGIMAQKTISARDVASQIANRIWECVCTIGTICGTSRFQTLEEKLGDTGMQVVRMSGGWNHLVDACASGEKTSHVAQWRDLAESILAGVNKSHYALPDAHREALGANSPKLLSVAPEIENAANDLAKLF